MAQQGVSSALPYFTGMSVPSRYNIVLLGDSITWYQSEVNTLAAGLGLPWKVINRGSTGENLISMLARVPTDVASVPRKNAVIILGGINDVVTGVSQADVITRLVNMYAALKALDVVVVAETITPFKGYGSWTAPRQAIVDGVNAWIMAGPANVDFLIDIYTQLEDPATPDTILPAYDRGDHLHMNAAGSAVIQQADLAGVVWRLV